MSDKRRTCGHLESAHDDEDGCSPFGGELCNCEHVKRCNDLLSGRCLQCDLLQTAYAQWRAIVDPMPAAPGWLKMPNAPKRSKFRAHA
jgi:hypothetical protein